MKKSLSYITCCILFGIYLPMSVVAAEPNLAASAKAAILLDVDSKRVLYEKNADARMLIASTTKIMTALLALEQGKLDTFVMVGPNAAGVEGSSIYLKSGEKIPLRTLLYGLMLRSGNDAATAIAEHIGGSVEGFVFIMNQKAEALGMTNTNFVNPSGLDGNGSNYSSARDMAILAAYALKNPDFQQIVKTKKKNVTWPDEEWQRIFINKNKLLRLYEGADGVKTGFTKKAGRTLVGSATKNGRQLVTVTLNDGQDWNSHTRMFNYGFNAFDQDTIFNKGEKIIVSPLKEVPNVVVDSSFKFPLSSTEISKITTETILTMPLKYVKHEQRVGSTRIYLDGKIIGAVSLTAQMKSFTTNWKQVLSLLVGQGYQGHD